MALPVLHQLQQGSPQPTVPGRLLATCAGDLAPHTDPDSLHARFCTAGGPLVLVTSSLDDSHAQAEVAALFGQDQAQDQAPALQPAVTLEEAALLLPAACPQQLLCSLGILAAAADRLPLVRLHAAGSQLAAVFSSVEASTQLPSVLASLPQDLQTLQTLQACQVSSLAEPSALAAAAALRAAGLDPPTPWANSSGHGAAAGVQQLVAVCLAGGERLAAALQAAAGLAAAGGLRLLGVRIIERLPAGTHSAFNLAGDSANTAAAGSPAAAVKLPAGAKLLLLLAGMDAATQVLAAPCAAGAHVACSHVASAQIAARCFGPDSLLGCSMSAALSLAAPSLAACVVPFGAACMPLLAQLFRLLDKVGGWPPGAEARSCSAAAQQQSAAAAATLAR
jgi:hypothetical protein